ncbi:hypothetical protein M0R72_21745 [Candidatus Pacearchaeota archaeon]|nr:hypothetical protein [Candidatus Pacearchaeota archaeon]
MSKYEELKRSQSDAEQAVIVAGNSVSTGSCDYVNAIEVRANARRRVRAFERAAAGLIERAQEVLKVDAWECSRARGDIECGSVDGCADCKTHKLLEEMEAL